jgi:hypothetical protein
MGNDSGYRDLDSKEYSDYIWSIIDKTIGKVNDVIDVGCGDLRFWGDRDCAKYIGIDASQIIIDKNKKIRPNWKFLKASSGSFILINAETVICANTLYHIMDDAEYDRTIANLTRWSNRWLVIIAWCKQPKTLKNKNDFYQKYRDFTATDEKILSSGFELVLKEPSSFDDCGCLWIYRRTKDAQPNI